MPAAKPHRFAPPGQPGSATACSVSVARHQIGRQRRLRRGGRHGDDGDACPIRNVPGAIVAGQALAKRQQRREEANQRSRAAADVRARAGGRQIACERVDRDPQPLLHVGDLGLGRERALRRMQHREHAGDDGQRQRRGDDDLEQREARGRGAARQNAFRAFAATMRDSACAASRASVTSTCRISVSPGSAFDQRRARPATHRRRGRAGRSTNRSSRRRCASSAPAGDGARPTPASGRSCFHLLLREDGGMRRPPRAHVRTGGHHGQLRERDDADGDDARRHEHFEEREAAGCTSGVAVGVRHARHIATGDPARLRVRRAINVLGISLIAERRRGSRWQKSRTPRC